MVKELIFSTDPPKNLYMVLEMNGSREGVRYKDIKFMIPVLTFAQPQVDSTNWYVVTFRNSVTRDVFNHYYHDEQGVEYELIMLPTFEDGRYLFSESNSLAFVDGTNFDCFKDTLRFYYARELDKVRELEGSVDGNKVDYSGLVAFLSEYRLFIEQNFPHILI